jgi:AraC-like DNA-binding protein
MFYLTADLSFLIRRRSFMDADLQNFIDSAQSMRSNVAGSEICFGWSTTEKVHIRTPDNTNGDQFVLTWLLTGCGSFKEGGREYKLGSMCVYMRRPGHDYRLYIDETRSVRLFFDLPYEMYPTLAMLIPEFDHIPPVREIVYRHELLSEFMNLAAEMKKTPVTSFYLIMPRLVHYILDLTGILADRQSQPLHRARALLENTSSMYSLEEIAESCGMNYNTFRKKFSSTFGMSPGKYRMTCRIEAAKNALAMGEPVASIAERLGFADIYTFTHRFTQVVGVSPTRYRDSNFR